LKTIFRSIARHTWQPCLRWYLSRSRHYRYKGIDLLVEPGVFHPGYFYSTKYLLEHLSQLDLKSKSLLELGCGSGLISIHAAKQGAVVTSSDINKTALSALERNARANHVDLTILHSDLFGNLPQIKFDVIVINPPYYKGAPKTEGQYAWYCGENYEYFSELFATIKNYVHATSIVAMILSEACPMTQIRALAARHGIALEAKSQKKFLLETNFIYYLSF
jgi:release factor glutamine methyltransferase